MKVLNDLLNYEGIKINQRTDMFNFSLDTVLLARFATLNTKIKNILDIGTNNAAIPLILSTLTSAPITGIELQKEAVQLAEENVALNHKIEQIKIIHNDINEYVKTNVNVKYDLIVFNPPFFKFDGVKLNEKNKLLIPARHETDVTLEKIIFAAKKLVANRGYFAIIHRTTRLLEITALLIKYGFNIKLLQFIHPFVESEANNVLIEARFKSGASLIVKKPIIVHNKNYHYTEQVLKLFRKYVIEMKTKLLKQNEKYVIGVSGGPDSMFLLDNIYNNSELDINNFIVCLVNYQKRKDSDYDEQIVVEYCQKRNIKVYVKKVTAKNYEQYQTNSHNFQAVARSIRYDFFLQISEKYCCQGVLIAHNLTDHIETYILQKQRNGIVEYYGLNKTSYYYSQLFNKKLKILRIMLEISRKEIIEYLFHQQINYAIDSTNILAIYNRNIIRNEIKDINLQDMLLEIEEKNKKNEQLKLVVKNYLIENFGQINVTSFNALNNIQLQKIIIFNYFKINKVVYLIRNKKRKFLDEIIKELKSLKPNIILKINSRYSLIKSYDNVEIVNNELLKLTTIQITPTTGLPIKWKENIINWGTKNKYDFMIAAAQWPITITNDLSLLRNAMINKMRLNRWFIKNKVPLLARKSYFVLDKVNNLIYANNLVDLKINKFINNTLAEKYNLFFFMIK